jgi:hypothetical protein
MKYLQSAPIVAPAYKAPANCAHGFIDRRGLCVFCGEKPTPKSLEEEDREHPDWCELCGEIHGGRHRKR